MARVLLVDDDVLGLHIRQLVLERHGHVVATAADRTHALAMFRAAAPEVAVVDLRLPEIADGLALIRELRALGPAARLVVLTGNRADLDGRPEAALVDRILGKPTPAEVLIKALV